MDSNTENNSSANIRNDIRVAFARAGVHRLSDDILSKCASLLPLLNVTPMQMTEQWEAYSLNKQIKTLDDVSYKAFREQLIKDSNYNSVLDDEQTKTDSSAILMSAHKIRKKQDNNDAVGDGGSIRAVVTPSSHSISSSSGSKRKLDDSSNGGANNNSGGSRRVSVSPSSTHNNPSSQQQQQQSTTTTTTTPTTKSSIAKVLLPKYDERQGSGKVVFEINEHLQPSSDNVAAPIVSQHPRCAIQSDYPTNVTTAHRHYFTVLDERAKALDKQLLEKTDGLCSTYGFGSEMLPSLESVGVQRQEAICCIGRIFNSSPEGRINAASIVLEGSLHEARGSRVDVDLSSMMENKIPYSLFPGQIVAVEGMNTTGRNLIAKRILECAPHEPNQSTAQVLEKYHHSANFQNGSPLKIVAAAGPFSCSDNLDYEPLMDLLTTMVHDDKPDVVVLIGPFVDMRHPMVAEGKTKLEFEVDDVTTRDVVVPFEVIFAQKIVSLLSDFYENVDSMHTQFVLVPSLDDATVDGVYPQAPFADCPPGTVLDLNGNEYKLPVGTLGLHDVETVGRGDNGGPQRIHCLSNPCTFRINDVVVGVTSTDILYHLSADETNANLPPGSRMGRLAEHLLQQRSYYPLYPPPSGTNVDLKRMDQWRMPCAPDMLILPSKLAPFSREISSSNTVVVNPGLLSRGTTGGTYAALTVHPIVRTTEEMVAAAGDNEENDNNKAPIPHNIGPRTHVVVKRI